MKLSYLILPVMLLTGYTSYAQNTPWSTSGPIGIGTTAPKYPLDVQHAGTGETGAIVGLQGFVNTPGVGAYLRLIKSRGTTTGTFSPTLAGDGLGAVDFMGVRTDNAIGYAARIVGYQDGTAGLSYIPGKLSFFTGSTANAMPERMTITSSGNVGIGTTTPDEKLVVNGNIKMVLEPAFPTKNNVRITTLGFSGPTGAVNWAIRGVYQYGPGVNFNADGGDLDIIKSWDGNTILGTKSDGTALGNVGIGLTYPQNKLDVNGTIHSKAVKIDLNGWPDYVFKKDYQLTPLSEIKAYIDQNQHLPEMPSEQEMVKNGLNVGEMNKLLMKKVEELTLYLIEKDKEVKEQKTDIDKLKEQVQLLINQSRE